MHKLESACVKQHADLSIVASGELWRRGRDERSQAFLAVEKRAGN